MNSKSGIRSTSDPVGARHQTEAGKLSVRLWPNLVICSCVCLPLLCAPTACSKEQHTVIPALDTKPWSVGERGPLYVKCINDGTGDILLANVHTDPGYRLVDWPSIPARKVVNGRPIYRYVASARKLVEIAPEIWDGATGEIITCGKQVSLSPHYGNFTHDLVKRSLQFNQKDIISAGPTVLTALPDPSKTYVAVLSATGEMRKSIIPFGDPTIEGDRYHQLFRMADATEVGQRVKLKVSTDRHYTFPCWSPDGRFVIYDELSERLWIVDVANSLGVEEKK